MGSVGIEHKIIISGAETVLCPHCRQKFPLADGISRQTIDRYADDFERTFAERGKALEAQLAADAQRRAERDLARHKAQFDADLKSATEALTAKEEALSKFRTAEIDLRRQLRELEDAKRNLDVEFQRKLDEERTRIEAHARSILGEEFSWREAQYNYICSPQFAQRVRSVVDGFAGMREELDAERRAMTRIWKKRETQLTRLTGGMLAIVGDLQGIGQEAGVQLDVIAALPTTTEEEELPDGPLSI